MLICFSHQLRNKKDLLILDSLLFSISAVDVLADMIDHVCQDVSDNFALLFAYKNIIRTNIKSADSGIIQFQDFTVLTVQYLFCLNRSLMGYVW